MAVPPLRLRLGLIMDEESQQIRKTIEHTLEVLRESRRIMKQYKKASTDSSSELSIVNEFEYDQYLEIVDAQLPQIERMIIELDELLGFHISREHAKSFRTIIDELGL